MNTLRRQFTAYRRRHGLRPLVYGAAVTVALTVGFRMAALAFPSDQVQLWLFRQTGTFYHVGNPLATTPLLGGLFGGCVTGYHTSDSWINCGANGLFAAVLGIGAIALAWSGLIFSVATFDYGMFPPPVMEIVLFPLMFLSPLFLASLVSGFVGGTVGFFLSRL